MQLIIIFISFLLSYMLFFFKNCHALLDIYESLFFYARAITIVKAKESSYSTTYLFNDEENCNLLLKQQHAFL